ncbi:hypothetical protein HHI36_003036 [Cryptolaemus montrouzieri]|uniref:CHK kinase-like domain-containing protein n=1 Tax=Cryptolaemus montrouzieri TaxID=559131 RepID=A0ABD2PCA0_9CUCU
MSNYHQNDLKYIIEEIIKSDGFSKNAVITFSKGREKCDGYMGDMVRIDIEENGRTLFLVAKISLKHKSIRSIVPVEEAYGNEIQFYENIFPALDEHQRKMKVEKCFDSVPRFFKSNGNSGEEYLILENLKELGYEMFNLKNDIDEEHSRVICETLGKFHALSFSLKYINPDKYYSLIKKLQCINLGFMKYKGGCINLCFKVIKKVLDEMGKSHERIDYYAENAEDVFKKVLYSSKHEEYSCILHLDDWLNNFMFKYKTLNGKRTLEDIKLLDWQACFYGSPVLDLSYFLYSAAPVEILNNWEIYLKIYYNALTTFLPQQKNIMEIIYPLRILKDHWKKYCEFGMIRGLIITKIKLSDTTNLVDPAESGESDYFERIMYADCDREGLCERVYDLFGHMENLGVFDEF